MITGYITTPQYPTDTREDVYRTSVYQNDNSNITICAFRYDVPEGVRINLTPEMAKDLVDALTRMLK